MDHHQATIRDLIIPRSVDLSTATTSSSTPKKHLCSCVSELLRRVEHLRREGQATEGDYALVHHTEIRWAKLFMEFILGSANCQASSCAALGDDMIWYVPKQRINASFHLGAAPQLQVYRRQSKKQPVACDSAINWEETQLDFFVTCAVCTKTAPQNLQIIRKNCQQVYPSPSRRRMDSKGEAEEITYPKIYFAIDDFEEVFNDIIVRDGECVCVELVVRDRHRLREAVVFLGSIRYEVLKQVLYSVNKETLMQVYDAKASSTWSWTQRFVKEDKRRKEFVRMRGPRGKMAVARVPGCGNETPQTERSHLDFPGLSQLESALGKRRMSEQNLAGSRAAKTPGNGTLPRGRRWQSEADTAGQYPEVEASSIDDELDEGVLSKLWSVRGFGQAWHWLREKKRAECTPLNAYLTYITLPWNILLADLLVDRPRRPILTFELETPTPTNDPTH